MRNLEIRSVDGTDSCTISYSCCFTDLYRAGHGLPVAGPAGKDFNILHAILLVIGVTASHIAVNLFNDIPIIKQKLIIIPHKLPSVEEVE